MAGKLVRELPGGLVPLDQPLAVRAHDQEPIPSEALHAHVTDGQERRGGVRLPGLGLAVHRGRVP